MTVKLRKMGNYQTLTVPPDIKIKSQEYTVKNVGDDIVYQPVVKQQNIFATADWKNYDYQADIKKDPALQHV